MNNIIIVKGRKWGIDAPSRKIDAALKKAAEAVITKPRSDHNALVDFFGMTFRYKEATVQLIPLGMA